MDLDQLLMTSIIAAIAIAIAWIGCALCACFRAEFRKGFGRAPLSAVSTCAATFALGTTWHGCGGWNAVFIPFIGAAMFGVLGTTIPTGPKWNAAYVALRIALPLAALAVGPHLPVSYEGCSV